MRFRTDLILRVTLSSLLLTSLTIPNATAESVSECKIAASPDQVVSLGFPLRKERLANLDKVNILVIPFKLKDQPNYKFTDDYKRDFEAAGKNIEGFSSGKVSINFTFAPTFDSEFVQKDIDELRANVQNTWQKDEAKSTWGFVRKMITDNDEKIDYSGIDAVILDGSAIPKGRKVAEAMMFSESLSNAWFRPATTAEGAISNAILMDSHNTIPIITHEILHLFGLTDLYGTSTGPGRLSLMESNELNLLTYEKWVLGWHPDEDVRCLNNVSNSAISTFTFDNTKSSQLAIIRSASGSNYVVETSRNKQDKYLAFYSVDNQARPPLKLFQKFVDNKGEGVLISGASILGSQLDSPEFTLLVSNYSPTTITFSLAPASQRTGAEFRDLVIKANSARDALQKAAAPKKATIICVKGKTTKKVTAVNPKCPSGYKKK